MLPAHRRARRAIALPPGLQALGASTEENLRGPVPKPFSTAAPVAVDASRRRALGDVTNVAAPAVGAPRAVLGAIRPVRVTPRGVPIFCERARVLVRSAGEGCLPLTRHC